MSSLTRGRGVTDEMIAEARAFTGTPLRVEGWNREATFDTIRHFAHGVGDANPLWCEDDYGAASVHGTVIAPPTFLYSIYDGSCALGLADAQTFASGASWTFFDHVRGGDRLSPHARAGHITVHDGGRAGRFIIQYVDVQYVRASDAAVVAEARIGTIRTRPTVDEPALYAPRERRQWNPDELDRISHEARTEPLRGANPRDVNDVNPGDLLPAVVKGPIDQMTMTAWYAGCIGSPAYKADELAWTYRHWARHEPHRLPANYPLQVSADGSEGHQADDAAHQLGMPGAFNNGVQKTAWMIHSVTNWMGDAASLRSFDIRLRRPDIFGDVVRADGRVVDVNRVTGVVGLELRAVNQLGEVTAQGIATVQLADRGGPTPDPIQKASNVT